MANYVRDQRLANLSISEDVLQQLAIIFEDRAASLNDRPIASDDQNERAIHAHVIRFDNKGYRVFSFSVVLNYFKMAKKIERVVLCIETGRSILTNRQAGPFIELIFDALDENNCFLRVSSDDRDWVDATFSSIRDVLLKYKNRNGWVRKSWTPFGIQIIGAVSGFIFSLWASAKIAPRLAIENSFIVSLLFVLLMFSNVWAFLYSKIIWLFNSVFPNMQFYRPNKEKLHWLPQAIVGSSVFAIILFILSKVFSFLMAVVTSFAR